MSITSEISSSWGDLQISQNAVGHMPHHNYHIHIYKSLDTKKPGKSKASIKYFYMPVVLLNPESAKYQYNEVTSQHVVSVDIIMSNSAIKYLVFQYLKESTEIEINDQSQVQTIPFEEYVLTSSQSELYECSPTWQPYQLHDTIELKLICSAESKGRTLERLLRKDPKQFTSMFNVKFRLATKQSQSKETVITVDNVLSGKIFAKLKQRFPTSDNVLLTADDAKQLFTQSARRVLVDTFGEDEFFTSESEGRIYRFVENLMAAGQQAINDQTSSAWDSVFWDDDNYRPDNIASTMNEFLEKTENENREKIVEAMRDSKKTGSELGASVSALGFSASGKKGCPNDETAYSDNDEHEESNRKLGESLSKIKWDGKKFVPKPMQLTRVNLASVSNKQEMRDKKETVKYKRAELTLPVNIPTSPKEYDAHDYYFVLLARRLAAQNTSVETALSAVQLTDSIATEQSTQEKLNAILAILSQLLMKNANDENNYVYFNACRSTKVDAKGYISYNQIKLNKSNCLDERGVFKAPTSGNYFFIFHGTKSSPDASVSLVVNETAHTSAFSGTSENDWHVGLSLSTVLTLKKGDCVAVYLNNGWLDGQLTKSLGGEQSVCISNLTSFSGFSLRP